MRSALVACPSCSCHVERTEAVCPHCGEPMVRSAGGAVALTASAVALGLAVSVAGTGLMACDGTTNSDYGAGGSIPEGGGGAGEGGDGEGGAVQSDYGAAPSR